MVEKVGNVAPVQKPVVAVEQMTVGEKKSKWWLWVVIALIVIGVIAVAWLLL